MALSSKLSFRDSFSLREGLLHIGLAGLVAALLAGAWVSINSPSAYVAVGLALVYGGLVLVGRPRLIWDGFVSVFLDSVLVSLLVAGTGGAVSFFFPLYLLASFKIVRASDNFRAAAGTLVLVGGYLVAAWFTPGARELFPVPAFAARVALVLLCCGTATVLAIRLRSTVRHAEKLSSALDAERAYQTRLEAAVSSLGPLLSVMGLDEILGWVADTAREVTGADYTHIATTDGRHRTAVEGNLDLYPSWWHPTIQRLVLHGGQTATVQRTGEAVLGLEGFLTVPLVLDNGAVLGAIVAGGGDLGDAEERILTQLAAKVSPALKESIDAPDGRDALTRLPNQSSLYRVLKRRLAYEGSLTVLSVRLDLFEPSRKRSGRYYEKAVLQALGEELSRAHRWVFYLEEGQFIVLLRGVNQARMRGTAFAIRRLAERAASEQGLSSTASVGYVGAEAAYEDPKPLVQAALDALHAATAEPERVAGVSVGDHDSAGRAKLSTRAEVALALVAAAETHSPPLGDHLRAVSRVAQLIGAGMGLTQDRLDTLVAGALLHDVGKIGVSDAVLRKAGPLSKEEEQIIRQHPAMGANLVSSIRGLEETVPAIKHHHEWFDGNGYPDGLRGEEIPLEARIVLVADAFEAMIRGRPYRFRRSQRDAVWELEHCAGTQFDPEVVKALVAVLETDGMLADSAN